jgi:hypothetical protein
MGDLYEALNGCASPALCASRVALGLGDKVHVDADVSAVRATKWLAGFRRTVDEVLRGDTEPSEQREDAVSLGVVRLPETTDRRRRNPYLASQRRPAKTLKLSLGVNGHEEPFEVKPACHRSQD